MRKPIVAIDFDGTIVEFDFPKIGKPFPLVFEWLSKIQEYAHLILWTVRSDINSDGKPYLTEAVDYCKANGIDFYGINLNPDQSWSGSPKVFADLYVDDMALGCPKIDWSILGPMIIRHIFTHSKVLVPVK